MLGLVRPIDVTSTRFRREDTQLPSFSLSLSLSTYQLRSLGTSFPHSPTMGKVAKEIDSKNGTRRNSSHDARRNRSNCSMSLSMFQRVCQLREFLRPLARELCSTERARSKWPELDEKLHDTRERRTSSIVRVSTSCERKDGFE